MIKPEPVIVFGEVLADIFPDQSLLGGAPFNVARHLQAFGLQPLLITRTGNDDLRQRFMHKLRQYGMDTSGFQLDAQHPTGQVHVVIEDGGHRFEIADDQAYDYIDADVALAATTILEKPVQITYFGTLAQRHGTSRHALQTVLAGSSGKKFLDINLRQPWYEEAAVRLSLQHANIVKMNEDELAIIASMLQLQAGSAEAQALSLLEQFSLETLVVTAGPAGAWQVGQAGQVEQAATAGGEQPAIVDTVGAGDAFAAVYILGLLRGWPAPEVLANANRFAAAMCGIRGAVADDEIFYAPFLQAWNSDA